VLCGTDISMLIAAASRRASFMRNLTSGAAEAQRAAV
jgi:hypothetical protein